MDTALDKLIQNNEFPIVFLGSGISKRFLLNFPDWDGLLAEFWKMIGLENYYGNFNIIRDEISKEHPEYTETELDHYSNIKIGSIIERKFNHAFNKGKITIDDFSSKDAHDTKISPFKKAISERFNKYNFIEGVDKELELFKKMLLKTQIILTTNYDTFIEDSYNQNSVYNIKKYIGQKGFFQDTYGYSEIYKIHGCIDSPADIIISEEDYERFDNNSVLISAKIISMLLYSPVIFIGYSLTDINVRNIIKEFTRSLSEEEVRFLEDKLVLIERKENEKELIEETVDDRDLGCKIKVIKTDNYEKVFEKISSVNQGIAPSEIRKYQHVIKKLIIDRGKKGALDTVLLSPDELDTIEEKLQNKNLAVAIGDSKYIFQIPNIISYSLDYISDEDEISTEIRMRFAIMQTGRFPINKILNEELINSSNLHPSEKEKLLQKMKPFSSFDKHVKSIVSSSIFIQDTDDVKSIINSDQKKVNMYETLSFNIRDLNLNEVRDFLISELEELKEKGEIKINTQLRRLLLLYDIVKNKRGNA